MQKLLKGNQMVDDEFQLLPKGQPSDGIQSGNWLVPASIWIESGRQLRQTAGNIGVWLDSDDEPGLIADSLRDLSIIAINFPKFADGRGYSSARILRDKLDFHGELRAIGDVLVDQLFFLKRCGFNSFDLRQDQNPQAALDALNSFTDTYQIASDRTEPVFKIRN